MNSADQVVRQEFYSYYMNARRTYTPDRPEQREYGFLLFKEKFMVRHRSFRAQEPLLQAIRELVPRHVYYSTAYYSSPTVPMEEKGWSGADLVFDIDADHLDTPCKVDHDTWKCKGCGTIGRGSAPKVCPNCKSEKIEDETWLCEQCLRQAREETLKLLDALYSDIGPDIGIESGNVKVFFSGHRGYHVHILSEAISVLDEEGRKEIVDYILGLGFDPALHLNVTRVSSRNDANIIGSAEIINGPGAEEPGWRKKIVMGVYELGNEKQRAELDQEKFLEKPHWSVIGIDKSKSLALRAVGKWKAGIDTVVTTDIHRLIRLPGTLNGHTGFLATSIPQENFEEFDPFHDAVAFSGTLKVHVREAPGFKLADKVLGPFHDETVELPRAAAILLLCKHRAEPAGARPA